MHVGNIIRDNTLAAKDVRTQEEEQEKIIGEETSTCSR